MERAQKSYQVLSGVTASEANQITAYFGTVDALFNANSINDVVLCVYEPDSKLQSDFNIFVKKQGEVSKLSDSQKKLLSDILQPSSSVDQSEHPDVQVEVQDEFQEEDFQEFFSMVDDDLEKVIQQEKDLENNADSSHEGASNTGSSANTGKVDFHNDGEQGHVSNDEIQGEPKMKHAYMDSGDESFSLSGRSSDGFEGEGLASDVMSQDVSLEDIQEPEERLLRSRHKHKQAGTQPRIDQAQKGTSNTARQSILQHPDIVQTEMLKNLDFVFNTKYNVLICLSCQSAINVPTLVEHFTNQRKVRDLSNKEAVIYVKKNPIHSFHEKVTAKTRKALVDDLITHGHIGDEKDISGTSEWKGSKTVRDLFEGVSKPFIVGLNIESGYFKCPKCIQAFISLASLKLHGKSEHNTTLSTRHTTCVQTFTRSVTNGFSWSVHFEESEMDLWNIGSAIDVNTTYQQYKMYKNLQLQSIPSPVPPRLDVMVPFIKESGISDFTNAFDWVVIKKTISAPNKNKNKAYKFIEKVHSKCYETKIDGAKSIHGPIAIKMTNVHRFSQQRPPFSVEKGKSTVSAYTAGEREFVWTLYQVFTKLNTLQNNPFIFIKEQETALKRFVQAVQSSHETASDLLDLLLESIYFPSDFGGLAKSIFASPLITFIVSKLFSKKGFWISDSDLATIPPFIAKLQFSIRLRAFTLVKARILQEPQEADPYVKFERFFEQYLQDCNTSPFAAMRYFLSGLSRFVLHSPRPAILWWLGAIVKIGPYELNIEAYKKGIHEQIVELIALIEKHVFFGLLKFQDSIKEHQKDYILKRVQQSLTLFNPQEDALVKQLKSNNIVFDDAKSLSDKNCLQYMGTLNYIWKKMYVLFHLTQGPPGRGTEEALLRPYSSREIPSNVVYRPLTKIGGIQTQYQKSGNLTGETKSIHRWLPPVVWWLYNWLCESRAMEVLVVSKVFKKDIKEVADVYATSMFATLGRPWKAEDMSTFLSAWFKERFDIYLGLRLYRHLSVAISYKSLESCTSEKAEHLKAIVKVMALQSSNLSHTYQGTLNYAEGCMAICEQWHDWHELNTLYDEGKIFESIAQAKILQKSITIPTQPGNLPHMTQNRARKSVCHTYSEDESEVMEASDSNNESSGSGHEEDDSLIEYEVVAILLEERRMNQLLYYVLWEGGECTWEPKKNLENAQDCLIEYTRRQEIVQKNEHLERQSEVILGHRTKEETLEYLVYSKLNKKHEWTPGNQVNGTLVELYWEVDNQVTKSLEDDSTSDIAGDVVIGDHYLGNIVPRYAIRKENEVESEWLDEDEVAEAYPKALARYKNEHQIM
ncbi:hypothetical protein BDN72DRAFT_905739 [Pluteus cervinus]|uniref:Uncharacterized protein n=1 Tax=Pluteus cervinus TaxID=181527 RepID=A0ACD3A1H2_9AGAR|nr:hypothetical protein BDN72DRAFT_905739 [Pluteus cervinus]